MIKKYLNYFKLKETQDHNYDINGDFRKKKIN